MFVSLFQSSSIISGISDGRPHLADHSRSWPRFVMKSSKLNDHDDQHWCTVGLPGSKCRKNSRITTQQIVCQHVQKFISPRSQRRQWWCLNRLVSTSPSWPPRPQSRRSRATAAAAKPQLQSGNSAGTAAGSGQGPGYNQSFPLEYCSYVCIWAHKTCFPARVSTFVHFWCVHEKIKAQFSVHLSLLWFLWDNAWQRNSDGAENCGSCRITFHGIVWIIPQDWGPTWMCIRWM